MSYPHWTLFQVIDEDLLAFSRQVEFADANFKTYSVALTRLYLSICSEIDVVAKLICQREQLSLPKENMDEYRKALAAKYPNLSKLNITIRPMARQILPWEEWDQNRNPTGGKSISL
jgi:hypothetical protein